jgi:hypothetical protein
MKINIIQMKSLPIISILGLFVVAGCLYFLAALPIINEINEANRELKEKEAEMERFLINPPSRERIAELLKEKEMFEIQYAEMVGEMGFPRPDPLLNFPIHFDGMEMEPLLDSFGTRVLRDYFEKELEASAIKLRHLGAERGLTIPQRLGFEEEEPETPAELALLLAGVSMTERLLTIAIEAEVEEISEIVAPAPPREGIAPEFKELTAELTLKTSALSLIELLDQLATGEYLFIIRDIAVISTPPHLEVELVISTQVLLEAELFEEDIIPVLPGEEEM